MICNGPQRAITHERGKMSIKKIDLKTGGKWKVTTVHGTYYIIDLDSKRGMRVPGPDRPSLAADNEWFGIEYISCDLGQAMYIDTRSLVSNDLYEWRLSTKVTKIEPILEEANNVS